MSGSITKSTVSRGHYHRGPPSHVSPRVLATMVAPSLFHPTALFLAGANLLPLANSQTVVSDNGVVLAANPNTVGPAAELVDVPLSAGPVELSSATQLTDAVLANVTAHALTSVELFTFWRWGAGEKAQQARWERISLQNFPWRL